MNPLLAWAWAEHKCGTGLERKLGNYVTDTLSSSCHWTCGGGGEKCAALGKLLRLPGPWFFVKWG